MAGVSKTNRSVDGRHTDRLSALDANSDSRSPYFFQLQWSEPISKGQHAKICQHRFMDEGSGCELCRSRYFDSVADNVSKRRKKRGDPVVSLPARDRDLGVTRQLPEACRLTINHARGSADEDAAALAHSKDRPDIDRRHDPDRVVLPVGGSLSASDHECGRE